MLPPVAALSDTALSQFNQSQHLPTPSRVQIGNPRVETVNGALTSPAALATDRRDVLSLSGQLQLAQGLSSVAEAVGGVLKLARHDGETLTDYADRLAETIAALPPAERVALQRVLMQLFKGVTLRLLVDILKNPFGPEATRLSLQLEKDAATERDPVTKLVVTSYRQNEGSGGLIGPPNRPSFATNGGTLLATVGSNGSAAVPPQSATSASTATVQFPGTIPGGSLTETAGLPVESEAPRQIFQQVNATSTAQPGMLGLLAPSSPAHQQEAVAATFANAAALPQTAKEPHGQAAEVRAEGIRDQVAQIHQEMTEVASPSRGDTSSRAPELSRPHRDDVTYDGPALARQRSQRMPSALLAVALQPGQVSANPASAGADGSSHAATTMVGPGASQGKPAAVMMETSTASTSDRYASIFAGDSFGDEFSFGPKGAGQISPSPGASVAAATSPAAPPPALSPQNAGLPVTTIVPDEAARAATMHAETLAAGMPVSTQAETGGPESTGAASLEAERHTIGAAVNETAHRAEGLPPAAMRSAPATVFVPPFVPYPVSSPVAKGTGDLVRAVEAVNEEGHPGRRRQGRGERDHSGENAQDETQEEARTDDALSATHFVQAEQEMVAKADSRALAPTAHLSGDRHGEAQDFYQRLAAW